MSKPAPAPRQMPDYEMAPEDDGLGSQDDLTHTKAMNSFNSLPESVRRMVMDADSESDY